MASGSSVLRKRNNTLDQLSSVDKQKKQKKQDLAILKDFHFQPEVSQADIENALPPGTSSYLSPASRTPTEPKANQIPTTTTPSTKPTGITPMSQSSTLVGTTQDKAFKSPLPVPKPTNQLSIISTEALAEQRSKYVENHLTIANAVNPIELKAIIDASIKESPTYIVSRLGKSAEFKMEVIDGALIAVESILQGLKSHGNPIPRQDSLPPPKRIYGMVNEFRFESPACFDNKEKGLACLLIGLISICPDHESAYQYITKWFFGKALRLTKDGKINLACRYTRILSLICKNVDDIQRLRVFCYDIVRYSSLATNFVGILLNVGIVWPEVLLISSHDFSQVGEEVIPKILQFTTAAYCKQHNSMEAVRF
ncbi:hypothetical protein CLU79DRAFT_524305 [Phycomyces nitens]|nr:hypothetical protein CLU79DRAFT_524305 [Phycomyces nitens]